MFTGRRGVRGRRLPPLSGRSLPPRRHNPARDVEVTRHQQGFPGSRPVRSFPAPVAAMAGATSPWALPRASHPAGQEPATHVTAGTGRTQTRSYVPGIRQTSSTSSLTACDLVSQPPPSPALPGSGCPQLRRPAATGPTVEGLSPPLESSAPHGARGSRLSLPISSLIHVRAPASITVYYRALSRVGRPSWSVLDGHPSSVPRKVEVLRAAPFYAGAVPLSAFPAQ